MWLPWITLLLVGPIVAFGSGIRNVGELLEPLLSKYGAPALGGLILNTRDGVLAMGVAGTRKRGSEVNVTSGDLWHMGSNTKAMTATLIARLVENGTVNWEDTVGGVFPSLNLQPIFNSINFLHLLSHRSGIPPNALWPNFTISAPTLKGQRLNAVKALNDIQLLAPPGEEYIYSNWGYVVAGAMIEEMTGQSYEDLMVEFIFQPLGMDSAGFGITSCGNAEVTQPWGHTAEGYPIQLDNELMMGPAGTVHCALEDWAKFVLDQLLGSLGRPALLRPESYSRLHTAPFNGTYALGWAIGDISWGYGPVLMHAGSNTFNYALNVIDPTAGIAVLSVSNQGNQGDSAFEILEILVAEFGFGRKTS